MNELELIKLYDKLLNKEDINDNLKPIEKELRNIIDYINNFMLMLPAYKNRRSIEVKDEDKLILMYKLMPVINKIIENNYIDSFKNINFFMLNSRVSGTYISEYLTLVFFPEESFKIDENDKEEFKHTLERYLFVIEQLMIVEAYDYKETDIKLFRLINKTLDYEWHNYVGMYNAFIPSIILFSIKNNYEIDKLIKMLDYSFSHYDELSNFMELNDDNMHDFELYMNVMNKINEGISSKQMIR